MLWSYNVQLLQAEWRIVRMFQQDIAAPPHGAIHALVVLQNIPDAEVQARMSGVDVLAAITAHEIHLQTTRLDLTEVAVSDGCYGRGSRIDVESPAFHSNPPAIS